MGLSRQPQTIAFLDSYWRTLSFAVTGKSRACVLVPGARDMVFHDTNAVPTVFTVTATRTVSPSGVALSWSGDGYYETAIGSFPVEFAMLVVIGGFEAGVAVSICGGRNNNSAAYNSQLAINASGFYELYDNATLRATGVSAAVPGDVVVIVRSDNGTVATVYTPREIITSGVVGQVASNVFRFGGTGRGFTGSKTIALFVGFSKPISSTVARALVTNPWQIYASPPHRCAFALPSAGSTYTIVAGTGEFLMTGVAAALQVARKLSAGVGAFSLTGVSANLKADRKLTAATGAFSLTGVDAALQVARKLTAGTGAYSLTGNDADLVYTPAGGVTYTLTADTGTFTLSGVDASLKVARTISAATGSFSLTGIGAGLQAERKLSASVGSFTLTGVAAALKVARKLSAETGVYTYTGYAASLVYGSTTYKATVLLSGVISKIPQAQVGTGLKPIVWVSNRFRQRQASEGTPLIFDPVTKRWRLLHAGETLEV